MLGSFMSMSMSVTTASAALPARSVQVPPADWSAPSDEIVIGSVTDATPDSASSHANATRTFCPDHVPGSYGSPPAVAVADRLGAVLSTSMSSKVLFVDRPALSVHEPVTDWFEPSVVTVTGGVTDATPEPASVHVKVTSTSPFAHVPASHGC